MTQPLMPESIKLMTHSQYSQPLPKSRKVGGLIFLIGLSVSLYASIFLSLYALLTLHFSLIIFLAFMVIIQSFLTKNRKFVDFTAKFMHPCFAFDSFKVIDDWRDQNASEDSNLERCIYAFHPHSVYALGFACAMNIPSEPAFCSMESLSSNFLLNLPFIGIILRLWGVGPASNSNFKRLMKQGKTISLLPGGFEEATITSPKQMRCWIKTRKGFIKYALEYKYTICPVMILKEHQGFWTFQPLKGLRLLLNKLKIPGAFFWSRQFGIFQPTNLDITVVKGRPILYSQDRMELQPSLQLIDKVHQEYIKEIERLYSKYKHLNGDKPLVLY